MTRSRITATAVCPECKARFTVLGVRAVLAARDTHRAVVHGVPVPPPARPFTGTELRDEIAAANAYLDDAPGDAEPDGGDR